MTSESVSGVLSNVHTVTYQRGQTLHFSISGANGITVPNLHTEEPLMFVKAQDGQQVVLTFTRETGYVSSFRITEGPSAGYAYDEPDHRNTFGAAALFVFGLILIGVSALQWVTDRQAQES
jgi:hypothetical protein